MKFVFFCNMGRATSRLALLGRLLRRRPASAGEGRAKRLPASVKLGHYEALRTLLLDPKVGMSCPEPIRTAETEGHDIGLHGGRNDGTWQNGFHSWRTDRIQREVSAGKIMFERVLDRSPVLFSSPGWQGSDTLNAILKDAGFKASADRHGAKEEDLGCENGFCTLPTNLLAEPGGVAYFESLSRVALTVYKSLTNSGRHSETDVSCMRCTTTPASLELMPWKLYARSCAAPHKKAWK